MEPDFKQHNFENKILIKNNQKVVQGNGNGKAILKKEVCLPKKLKYQVDQV